MEDGKSGFRIVGVVFVAILSCVKIYLRSESASPRYPTTSYQDLLPEPLPPAPAPPVVFALEIAGRRIDVEGDSIELAGRMTQIERGTEVTFTHEDIAFEHPANVDVNVEAASNPFELLATVEGGALIRFTPVRRRDAPMRVAETTVEALLSVGATRSAHVPALEVGGAHIAGTRLDQAATGMTIDVYPIRGAVPLVVSYFRPTSAPEDPGLARMISSFRHPGEGEPVAPDLTLIVAGERVALSVDVPKVLPDAPEVTLTLRRRATVRRTLSGITFEHDASAAASETIDALAPRVQLHDGAASVQVLVVRDAAPDTLLSGLTTSLPNTTPWERSTKTFGEATWSALRGAIRTGDEEIATDVYARTMGPFTLALLVQYPQENAVGALALATTVATTVRAR